MEINRNNIKDILNDFGISPTKENGQNFLIEPIIAKRIVSCLSLEKNDLVLEIGPGLGSLTNFLVGAVKLNAVDIDEKIVYALKSIYRPSDVIVEKNNIFCVDISKYTKIISNIPYSVTANLLEYVLLNSASAKEMVFMCQKEVVDKLVATHGPLYGPLSVLIGLFGSIKKQFDVSPCAFLPKPKCVSTVFKIKREDKYENVNIQQIYNVVKKLFSNRRKTILNNLSAMIGKSTASEILSDSHIADNLRPEELTVNNYVDIYFSMKKR